MNEEALFAEALKLPPEERAEFLRQKPGEDEALRKGVEELLELFESGPIFVDELYKESAGIPLSELTEPLPGAAGPPR